MGVCIRCRKAEAVGPDHCPKCKLQIIMRNTGAQYRERQKTDPRLRVPKSGTFRRPPEMRTEDDAE